MVYGIQNIFRFYDEEKDKSSDIGQQSYLDDRKYSNTQLQNGGGTKPTGYYHIILTKHEAVHPTKDGLLNKRACVVNSKIILFLSSLFIVCEYQVIYHTSMSNIVRFILNNGYSF